MYATTDNPAPTFMYDWKVDIHHDKDHEGKPIRTFNPLFLILPLVLALTFTSTLSA